MYVYVCVEYYILKCYIHIVLKNYLKITSSSLNRNLLSRLLRGECNDISILIILVFAHSIR